MSNGYIYHRLGIHYSMQVVPVYGGQFVSGEVVQAVVRRHSDGAFFNFKVYSTDPTASGVWAAAGSLPPTLTDLYGNLTELKLGSVSLMYNLDWTFPENRDEADANPSYYTIWYFSPGTLGLISTETVVFIPRSLSFNAYYATPMDQANISVVPG